LVALACDRQKLTPIDLEILHEEDVCPPSTLLLCSIQGPDAYLAIVIPNPRSFTVIIGE
jgi:hypothetical protein